MGRAAPAACCLRTFCLSFLLASLLQITTSRMFLDVKATVGKLTSDPLLRGCKHRCYPPGAPSVRADPLHPPPPPPPLVGHTQPRPLPSLRDHLALWVTLPASFCGACFPLNFQLLILFTTPCEGEWLSTLPDGQPQCLNAELSRTKIKIQFPHQIKLHSLSQFTRRC